MRLHAVSYKYNVGVLKMDGVLKVMGTQNGFLARFNFLFIGCFLPHNIEHQETFEMSIDYK